MVVRFKRSAYGGENSRGDVPRWHIAAHAYRKGELYKKYVALCGYEIEMPFLQRRETLLSHAKTVRGPQCSKCIAKAARLTE